MTRRAWWAFAFMSIVWGGSYLLIKIAINGGITAPDVAWLRVAIAAVLLVAVAGGGLDRCAGDGAGSWCSPWPRSRSRSR